MMTANWIRTNAQSWSTMRVRLGLSIAAGSILAISLASTAFAAHCFPVNKPDGAGQKLVVLINPATGAPTFIGTNAAGRLTGGFADVYLDLDGSGTLTPADLQVEDFWSLEPLESAVSSVEESGN